MKKMRTVKKMLSILLAIAMLAVVSVPALAADNPVEPGLIPMHAETVVNYFTGTQANGGPVLPMRANPAAALGAFDPALGSHDDGVTPECFYSLGFGGWIILAFPEEGVPNQAGADIVFREVTNKMTPPYPREAIKVYGTNKLPVDGGEWTYFRTVTNAKAADGVTNIDNLVEFPENFATVKYLYLVDDTNIAQFANIPNADGYDLDAVEAYYKEADTSVDLRVLKKNIAGALIINESFTFNLYATDVNGNKDGPILQTRETGLVGMATFSDLEPGKKYYVEEALTAEQLTRFYTPKAGIVVTAGSVGGDPAEYPFYNDYKYGRTEITKYVGLDTEGFATLDGTRFTPNEWYEYATLAADGSGAIDIIAGNAANQTAVIGTLSYTLAAGQLTASYTLKPGIQALGNVQVPVYTAIPAGVPAANLVLTAPGVAATVAVPAGALYLDLDLQLKDAWVIDATTPAGPFYIKITGPTYPLGKVIAVTPGVMKTFQFKMGDYTIVECDAQGNPIVNPAYRLVADPGTSFTVAFPCETVKIRLLNVPILR